MRDAFLDTGINGVFGAEGADWRRQRKLVMQALNTDHLRKYFDRLDQVAARLQRRWQRAARDGAPIDVPSDLKRFTVDVTSGLAFGTDLNTLEDEGDVIQHYLDKIFPVLARRTLAPFRYWRWVRWGADRKVDAAMQRLMEVVHDLVSKRPVARVRETTSDAVQPATGDGGGNQRRGCSFHGREIAGNILTIFLAGEDTTANTLAWMMHLMASIQRYSGRCRPRQTRCWARPNGRRPMNARRTCGTSRPWRRRRCACCRWPHCREPSRSRTL